jgi:hypothetical protein
LDVLVLNKQRNCQKTQDGQKEENDWIDAFSRAVVLNRIMITLSAIALKDFPMV